MPFDLKEVVPWGRCYQEYVAMFSLDAGDLAKRCLGCGDGPASFNSTLTARGGSVVSVDPIYSFTAGEIMRRVEETFPVIMEQTRLNRESFVWKEIDSLEELGRVRMQAMSDFVADFERGKGEGRYVAGELPHLPFPDASFDLAFCSHFLFLYSDHLDMEFHLDALRELCRVAAEVRVFPMVELSCARSRHLEAVVSTLSSEGYQPSVEEVPYEFQKGGNQMLRIRKSLPDDSHTSSSR